MCKGPAVLGTRRVVGLAFAGVAAALLAGCADTSAYIGDPLGNPFKTAATDPTPTASYDREMAPPAPYRPRTAIASQPLAPPSSLPARHVAIYTTPAHPSPRLASTYVAPRTERTASIAVTSGHGGWSAQGGMPVVAATGETAAIIAARYNVPTEVLLQSNGLRSAAQIRPGTRIVIPVFSASARPAEVARVETTKVEIIRKPKDHASREKLLAKHEIVREKVVVSKQIGGARKEIVEEHEIMHWKKGPQPAKVTKLAKVEKTVVVEKPRKLAKGARIEKTTKVEVAETAPIETPRAAAVEKPRAVDPTPTASLPPATEKVATSGNPEFRWPAHGRIIQGFHSAGNDGINIAVPEGTSVKAAESGIVAYAGSEIKGFGNLVLIRHPNGYVTAYANNGALDVHRGEQVKRGQVIAKSGQTGNVASPQLHFEVRKGSTPVDPTRYLAGL